MTFWQFADRTLDRLPGWPTERQWVIVGIATLIGSLLKMAEVRPDLWDVEVFKVIIQAAVLTGALNMILAFYFAANKADEVKSDNTARAFEAITATANASAGADPNALSDGDKVTMKKEPEQ